MIDDRPAWMDRYGALRPAEARAARAGLAGRAFDAGQAAGLLHKSGAGPASVYALSGRLYLSGSGWLLLDVPNALVRGLFAALDVPGAELPPGRPDLSAHISVMTAEEVAGIGAGRIAERGKRFRYQLGPIQEVAPAGWPGMSRVWFVRVESPELKKLRASYGLTPLLRGDHPFHISVGVRRRGVLAHDATAKGGR